MEANGMKRQEKPVVQQETKETMTIFAVQTRSKTIKQVNDKKPSRKKMRRKL